MLAVANRNGKILYIVWAFCKSLTHIIGEETNSASVSFPETQLVTWGKEFVQ